MAANDRPPPVAGGGRRGGGFSSLSPLGKTKWLISILKETTS